MIRCLIIISLLYSCSLRREADITFSISNKNQVQKGKEWWQGADDCSAKVNLSYTHEGLNIIIDVIDDTLCENKNAALTDGIELYFDLRPLRMKKINEYQKGVFQITILPGFTTKKDKIKFYPSRYLCEIPGTSYRVKHKNNGYVVSVFIPADGLQQTHYLPRSSFGFDIALLDADNDLSFAKLFYYGDDLNWKKPSNFALVTFKNQ